MTISTHQVQQSQEPTLRRVVRFQDEIKPCSDDDESSTCSSTSSSSSQQQPLESYQEYERYSQDEDIKADVWFTPNEYSQTKANYKRDVRVYKLWGRRNSDNMTFSSWGLHNQVGKGKRDKEEARQAALWTVQQEMSTVLLEWEKVMADYESESSDSDGEEFDIHHQHHPTTINHEHLATIYGEVTKESQRKAHDDAVQLAKDVQQLLL